MKLFSLGVILASVSAVRADVWSDSVWLSAPEAQVFAETCRDGARAADGTSWFVAAVTNGDEVVSARWTTAGLGVYDVYVNGRRVGDDFLKPGYTHNAKTKYSFTYDVTPLVRKGRGEVNLLAAEVSAGWWRDKICSPANRTGFFGRKSAFRGVLEIRCRGGAVRRFGTNAAEWRAGMAGPVTHAAIYDGEEYDARRESPALGGVALGPAEVNDEFQGEILPTAGAEVTLRRDLAICRGPYALAKGETLVIDFGQNCAAVPTFRFTAKRGVTLTVLPAEMLNDADAPARGCDGPKGSVYRQNLRVPDRGMRIVYTFRGDREERYLPRFTFFGYRYLALSATDDVDLAEVTSVPVSSVRRDQETGSIETGDASLNRFIRNVYWSQLSNYLSVPTDCPQRNERLGWSADTQVFCEAGSFNADTRAFFGKWMRDMRDSRGPTGGFASVAPFAQYGNETMCFGWADAGVIVPYTVWRHFGDLSIVRANWEAMRGYVARVAETKYDSLALKGETRHQYADWLSFEDFDPASGRSNEKGPDGRKRLKPAAVRYFGYLGACYWLYDARLMAEMAEALGENAAAAEYRTMAEEALAYIRRTFVADDGLLHPDFRELQTASVFALRHGILPTADAVGRTKELLLANIRAHGGCLQTGFLGTSFLMDALADSGLVRTAYDLLLNHAFPSWLYSVDQGATTVWERWNSYTRKDGFGPVGMNSFNHYAYGAVLGWLYRSAAGIASCAEAPGFRRIRMRPLPDRRLGFVKAAYRSVSGLIRSEWHYEGDWWVWTFTVPDGCTAEVTLPGEKVAKPFAAGTHTLRKRF